MTSAAATNPGFGVSTSPSADELKRFAMLVLDNVELDPRSFGVNRINRLAVRFTQRMPNATFWAFFLYLTNDVLRLSEKQRQSALLEYPAIYRIVSLQRGRRRLRYADPIGEDAVWNVANPSKPPRGYPA